MVGTRWVQKNRKKQIAVYDIPYHLSLDCIQSSVSVSIMDSVLRNKTDKIHFHVNPNRLLWGVDTYADTSSYAWKQLSFGKVLVWDNTSNLVLEEEVKRDYFPFDMVLSELHTDEVILGNKTLDLKNEGLF